MKGSGAPLVKAARRFPHTAAARADRINSIHCAVRSCKALCAFNAESMESEMMNILEELANDNLHPSSRYYRRNSEFDRAVKRVADTESALRSVLSQTEKSLFDAYAEAQDEISYLSSTDTFVYGYRLGALMMIEVFRTSDEIVTGGEE